MESHSCIHFACHAQQNTQEPLKSSFMLHDGGLELSDIIKKQLVGADLAFLSAYKKIDSTLLNRLLHLILDDNLANYIAAKNNTGQFFFICLTPILC